MINNSRKITYTLSITALFIALAFVMTYVSIPVGVSKVHLGNFVCLIASLLCGPLIGGISGALGMGLNDLVSGYGPDTIIKTVIVKFLMGYLAGLLFRALLSKSTQKEDFSLTRLYTVLTTILGIVFITLLVLYITKGASFAMGEKTFKSSLGVVIASGVFTLLLGLLLIFSHRIKLPLQCVLIAVTVGTLINIIAEFLLKIPLKMLFLDFSFEAALAYATASLPGALITGIITIIITTAIYPPLNQATKKINKFN